MLLIHGTADKTVPIAQSMAMADRLRAAGVPVETLFIPDVDHGLLNPEPMVQRQASLQALQRTFDFFDRLAGNPSGKRP